MMEATKENQFKPSTREVQTAISSDIEMSIRTIDWKRIHRKIGLIPRDTNVYEIAENISWGVATAAAFALIPIYQATEHSEPWVKPTFILVGLAAFVVAKLSRHFSKERKKIISANCDEILDDMDEVYKTFFPHDSLGK
jgi:hypothetical protein